MVAPLREIMRDTATHSNEQDVAAERSSSSREGDQSVAISLGGENVQLELSVGLVLGESQRGGPG
jgi:hypothetical protein